MADKHYSVQIKRGTLSELKSVPNLLPGELVWVTDQEDLYIGTENGNRKVTSYSEVMKYLDDNKLTLGDLLDGWKGDLQEIKDLVMSSVVAGFAADPLLIDNFNNPANVRAGLIVTNDDTLNLPAGFVK